MKSLSHCLRLSFIVALLSGFTGCAPTQLNENSMSVAIASSDMMTDTVVLNIAKIRAFPILDSKGNPTQDKEGKIMYNYVMPIDSHISAGQDVLNDTLGITAGAALGGAHGIIVPNISLPYSHSVQQQANSTPASDGMLLAALAKFYHDHVYDDIFHSGAPPIGKSCQVKKYLNSIVWVDNGDMGALTSLAMQVLGGDVGKATTSPKSIYDLRQSQSKNQANKTESTASPSIRSTF